LVERTILHCDLDAFYASVEQRDDPSLMGKPVIVGGHSRRGVVSAASYEARKYGVRSAMSMFEAMQLCPKGVVITPRMSHYADVSGEFFAILGEYTPLVEGLSLDEAFLDVTASRSLFGDGVAIARAIKQRVRAELRLVVSVGVAPVKFAAKIASDLRKPDGLVLVEGNVAEFLAPLPISRLWGVGKVTEQTLRGIGLQTIGDVAKIGERVLAARIGADGAAHLSALARGEDARHVEPERAPVSLGSEDTFERDVHDRAVLIEELLAQGDRVCARLREHGLRARVVTIKVKYSDHELVTRRTTLPRATVDGRVVGRVAGELLALVPDVERRGVRLTGVSLSGLADRDGARQLGFDEKDAERGEHLGDTLDRIAARFGDGVIKRAVHVAEEKEDVSGGDGRARWRRPPGSPPPRRGGGG
jgi:DNA polymerase IV